MAPDPSQRGRLEMVIYNLLESLRIIAVLILPFMPDSAKKIMEQIGIGDIETQDFKSIRNWGGLPAGNALRRAPALFPRVANKEEEDTPGPVLAP